MIDRCHIAGLAALLLLITGCHSPSQQDIQQGVDNGGLTAGDHGVAQKTAAREVHRQSIDLTAAMAQAYTGATPKSCPSNGVIELVLEGSFPSQTSNIKAQDIYINPMTRRICAGTYLTSVPHLRSDLGTLYVPGTPSTGE